jgi:hypothetical protein
MAACVPEALNHLPFANTSMPLVEKKKDIRNASRYLTETDCMSERARAFIEVHLSGEKFIITTSIRLLQYPKAR